VEDYRISGPAQGRRLSRVRRPANHDRCHPSAERNRSETGVSGATISTAGRCTGHALPTDTLPARFRLYRRRPCTDARRLVMKATKSPSRARPATDGGRPNYKEPRRPGSRARPARAAGHHAARRLRNSAGAKSPSPRSISTPSCAASLGSAAGDPHPSFSSPRGERSCRGNPISAGGCRWCQRTGSIRCSYTVPGHIT